MLTANYVNALACGEPDWVKVKDLDGDGIRDLVGGSSTSLSIWYGTGSAATPFKEPVCFSTPAVDFYDVDGDGREDIAGRKLDGDYSATISFGFDRCL